MAATMMGVSNQRWTPERVRALRARLGLSQSQFAGRIGCHVRAISKWERGERHPTGLYAQALDRLERETAAH